MIMLDTHAWVWFISNPELFSRSAKKAVNSAMKNNEIYISSISAWEVALLVAKGRLKLTMDVYEWIAQSERLPFFNFIPVDNSVAIKSVNLPKPIHNDPADRIIIATTLTLGVSLITKDERILDYPHVQTLW